MQNTNIIFVDENEKEIATLGGSYLQNFLNTGDLSKGFCVVSDKRAYFNGKCFYRSGNHFKTTNEEKAVDLKDITGTGFALINPISYLVISIVSLVLGMLFMTVNGTARMLGVILILCAIGVGIIYFVSKVKVFEIVYSGGSMAFKVSDYNLSEIQEFQKTLRRAKDKFESVRNTPVNHVSASTGDELKKYKELLDSGAISEEEYKILKQKVMN